MKRSGWRWISESPDASAAADVLTAELSSNKKLQMLERNEIEKVYREQGLSAGNRDYLKLGQILGADGLLLFDVDQNQAGDKFDSATDRRETRRGAVG